MTSSLHHLNNYDITITSSHLRLGADPDVPLYGGVAGPALSPAHWFLNAEVGEGVFTKDTLGIKIGSQEPTLPRQSLGMGEWKYGNGGMETWEWMNGSMGMGDWDTWNEGMKYLE